MVFNNCNFKILKTLKELKAEFPPISQISPKRKIVLASSDDALIQIKTYLKALSRGQTALVLNPKIPFKVRDEIYTQVLKHYKSAESGHILCSSGTTSELGMPKTFFFTLESAFSNARAHCESLEISGSSNILFPLPLTHSFGIVVGILGSIIKDSNTYLFESGFTIADIFDALRSNKFEVLYLTPSLVRQINKFAKRYKKEICSPKKISIGSSILYYEDLVELNKVFPDSQLYYTYGLTEMGPRVSTYKIEHIEGCSGLIPIGRPLEGVSFELSDTLKVKSIYCAEQFSKTYFDTQDELIVRSDEVFVMGRKDDTIIFQGINIYPSDIELLLDSTTEIGECVMVGLPSNLHGQIPVLVVKGDSIDEGEIIRHLRQFLPESHLPKKVYRLDHFPKTALGKIQRKKIISMLK